MQGGGNTPRGAQSIKKLLGHTRMFQLRPALLQVLLFAIWRLLSILCRSISNNLPLPWADKDFAVEELSLKGGHWESILCSL